jgi:hypothetical protein
MSDQGEGEDALFDDSANPSQKPEPSQPQPSKGTGDGKQADHADKHAEQDAEVIPEEEQQLS